MAATTDGTALSAAERRKALINNEAFSDVTFYIGKDEQPIHAHKVILAGASEYFGKEFMSNPKKGDPQCRIMLPDVDPRAFRWLLEYIYCGEVELSMENVRPIFLLAKRFSIAELRTSVEEFLMERVTTGAVLEILVLNEFFQLDSVEELCLQQIGRNPLRYFKCDNFVKITYFAMFLIVKWKAINCTDSQLLTAVEKWGASHPDESTDEMKSFIHKTVRIPDCRLCRVFGSAITKKTFSVSTLVATEPVTLHGLGLYIKSSKNIRVSLIIRSGPIDRVALAYQYEPNEYGNVDVVNLFFEPFRMEPDKLYTIKLAANLREERLEVSYGQTTDERVRFVYHDDKQEYYSTPVAYVLVA